MDQEVLASKSIFRHVEPAPPDPIFGLNTLYNEDQRKDKINLTVGYLATEKGSEPTVLEVVREVSKEMADTEKTKNYFPISGNKDYVESVRRLIFGDLAKERTLGFGTAGGTAALRLVAEFAYDHMTKRVCFSDPTWPNHVQIFNQIGFEIDYYPYEVETEINFDRIIDHLSNQPHRTLILFQPMSHNPTGYDFSLEEWKALSDLCKEKKLIPFFDSAYQGLGVGVEEDVAPIHLFIEEGHELFVAHSFSKSMGLYGERVGAAYVVMNTNEFRENVGNQMKVITRTQYSNPPRHGELLAQLILSSEERKKKWLAELKQMRERVDRFRQRFADAYEKISGKDCSYIRNGHGFFCRLGLSKEQVIELRDRFAIYLSGSSRINLAALNDGNFDTIINSLNEIIKSSEN